MVSWSPTQLNRLKELGAKESDRVLTFASAAERDETFRRLVSALGREHIRRLKEYQVGTGRPGICLLEDRLVKALTAAGFAQVITPLLMSKGHLQKMTIDENHPLFKQVYWVDRNKCLRPMLAPHLYYVSRDLLRIWDRPVRIFEVGPCFRKETDGAQHSSEFTMLNLVEYGTPMDRRESRLRELADLVMASAGLKEYDIDVEYSEVYGETVDVVTGSDRLEVASGAMGPHVLDAAWRIVDTWVGIGFGLERLLMVIQKSDSLSRVGRSLSYLNGARLNV